MLKQYYNTPPRSTVYCKECGCAVDVAAENQHVSDNRSGRIKLLIIILFIALAILSVALIICAHIISDLKKSACENSVYICDADMQINDYIENYTNIKSNYGYLFKI